VPMPRNEAAFPVSPPPHLDMHAVTSGHARAPHSSGPAGGPFVPSHSSVAWMPCPRFLDRPRPVARMCACDLAVRGGLHDCHAAGARRAQALRSAAGKTGIARQGATATGIEGKGAPDHRRAPGRIRAPACRGQHCTALLCFPRCSRRALARWNAGAGWLDATERSDPCTTTPRRCPDPFPLSPSLSVISACGSGSRSKRSRRRGRAGR
jgi:hypothetical protein